MDTSPRVLNSDRFLYSDRFLLLEQGPAVDAGRLLT